MGRRTVRVALAAGLRRLRTGAAAAARAERIPPGVYGYFFPLTVGILNLG